jgi:methylmalonyl-CoA mutase
MTSDLFSEFGPLLKKDWQKQVEKELKGRAGSLPEWKTDIGISFEHYCTGDDLDHKRVEEVQRFQRITPGWFNIPELDFTDARDTNSRIVAALDGGADAILLNLANTPFSQCEFPKLLHSIRLSETAIYFHSSEDCYQIFTEISKNAGYYLKGGIAFDPIAHWMLTGKPYETAVKSASALYKFTKNMKEFRPVMVNGSCYHNAGADPVQELALIVSAAVCYMDMLTDEGISALPAFNRLLFSVSVGPEYLTEITKLRALRYLLRKVATAYQLPDEIASPFIHVRTSSFYHSPTLPHTNMIRSSSEAISAVIGGCNALSVAPYTQQTDSLDSSPGRIASNVSSVLRYESYLAHVADPAAGSYLMESISLKLADAAWLLFLEMEKKGGLIPCFKSGYIQDKLDSAYSQKLAGLHNDRVVVGVNEYLYKTDIETVVSYADASDDIPVQGLRLLKDRNLAAAWHSGNTASN